MGALTSVLAKSMLAILHAVSYAWIIIGGLLPRREPWPIIAERRQTPRHVALLLHVDPADAESQNTAVDLLECVRRTVDWCQTLGASSLAIYDERGLPFILRVYSMLTAL